MRKPELLAPAGSVEALRAAVNAGADAVYFGGARHNARAGAENFDRDGIAGAIDYCHQKNVKSYITLNTLISDREMDAALEFAMFVHRQGADAVIIQDVGMMSMIRRYAPDFALHASTQSTVYDAAGVDVMKGLGVRRVILARELTLGQIADIRGSCNVELEVFAHGALCVGYSGQCLISSFIGNRSGNRGRCAQPCRLPYTMNGTSGYLLNIKDNCLLRHIRELTDVGVTSLKIEGRMKGADYVAATVAMYRKYLDSMEEATDADCDVLLYMFNRGGLTDGYLTGKRDSMLQRIKPGNPYAKAMKYIYSNKQVELDGCFVIKMGSPAVLTLTGSNGVTACTKSVCCAENRSVGLTPDRIAQQIRKTNDSGFSIRNLTIDAEQDTYIPISAINRMRRECLELIGRNIAASYKRQPVSLTTYKPVCHEQRKFEALTVAVRTFEQYDAVKDMPAARFYIPYSVILKHGVKQGGNIYVSLPCVCDAAAVTPALKRIRGMGFKNAAASNIGQAEYLSALGFDVHANHNFNIYNSQALEVARSIGIKSATLSVEANIKQISALLSPIPLEALVYGYIPVMHTKNCIIKAHGECKNGGGGELVDRAGMRFTVHCGEGCTNYILNSVPVVMADKRDDIINMGCDYLLLSFTVEPPARCGEIFKAYNEGLPLDTQFTRGKFYKPTT